MKGTIKQRAYLRFCWNLLRYKPGITLANVLCNAVIFSYWAFVTYCFRQILNQLQLTPQGGVLSASIPYLIGILAISAVRGGAILLCSYLDRLRSYYYQERTRANALARIYHRDAVGVAGHSGKIFEVLDDDIPAATFPPELLTEVTGYVIFTITAIVMMLCINWMVTLFIFIPLSLAIFGVQKLSQRMKEKRKANREAHDEVSGLIADVTGCVLAIKTAGAEAAVLDRAQEVNRQRRGSVLADVLFSAKTDALLKGAVSIGTVLMMAVAASLIPSGKLLIGDFSLFVLHLGTLADCVNRVVELIYEGKKAEVSYERMLETIGQENKEHLLDDVGLSLKPGGGFVPQEVQRIPLRVLEARGLSFQYGEGRGFHDVNLRVHPGELIVICGEVGSGKSTLLAALSGVLPVHAGQLLWNGVDMAQTPALHKTPMVASAPQRAGFFSADLRTNICLGYPATEEALAAALRLAALDDTVAAMEHGLDTQIGDRGEALSGGQRQRLALARLFLRDAEVSIIDDHISGLDESTLLRVRDNICRYIVRTNHSVIIATNHEAFRQAATRVVTMRAGRIVEEHAPVFANP